MGRAKEAPVDHSREQIRELYDKAIEMLSLVLETFLRQETMPLGMAEKLGREIHQREKDLTALFVERGATVPGDLRFAPMHLERIGDSIEGLTRCVRTMLAEGTVFTEKGIRETNTLFEKTVELLECGRDLITTGNRILHRHVTEEGQRLQAMADDYALAHQQRLLEGVCMAKASSTYLGILDYLREIERHNRRIAEKGA